MGLKRVVHTADADEFPKGVTQMKSSILARLCVGLAGAALLASVDAAATTVDLGTVTGWQSFDVDNTSFAVAAASTSWTDQASYVGDGSLLNFTATLTSAETLQVVDLGYSGDIFQVYDNGALIGTTSAVSATGNGTTYVLGQANQAFADAAFSSGSFILGAGSHSITGVMIQSANDPVLGTAFNATQGAVLLAAPVPEPTTWMLMSGGLLGLVLLSRARQTRRLPQALITGAVVAAALAATPASAATVTARVIAFNDFHGNLQSPGKFNLVTSTGGADYLAAYIASLKAANPNNIVVHAGDMVGASPLISAFFHDEGTIEVMNQVGVDISSVGNHEFDGGMTELLRKQSGGSCFPNANGVSSTTYASGVNSCEGSNPTNQGSAFASLIGPTFQGARFKYLAANVAVTATGKTLFPAYYIKTFNGVRVAFIGMTLRSTPTIVTPTGVAGLQFNDEAATVNALIPQLRARGVNAIIVVIHQGGAQGAAPNDLNNCSELNPTTPATDSMPSPCSRSATAW